MNKLYLGAILSLVALTACQQEAPEPASEQTQTPTPVAESKPSAPTTTPPSNSPPSNLPSKPAEPVKLPEVVLSLPKPPSFNLAESAKGQDLSKLTYDQYKEKEQQMKQQIVAYSKAAQQERSKHQEEIGQLWDAAREVSSSVLTVSQSTNPFVFLPPNSNPEGSIEVEMLISKNGQVLDAKVASSTFADKSVDNAVVASILLEKYVSPGETVRTQKTISIAPKD